MKDTELRGIVLQHYYEKPREPMFKPKEEEILTSNYLECTNV